MNVSERSIYKARELLNTGREDLIAAVDQGRLTIHAALKLAKPEKYDKPRDGLKALQSGWLRSPKQEQLLFLAWLDEERSS